MLGYGLRRTEDVHTDGGITHFLARGLEGAMTCKISLSAITTGMPLTLETPESGGEGSQPGIIRTR